MTYIDLINNNSLFVKIIIILILIIIVVFLFWIFPNGYFLRKIVSDYKETKDPLKLQRVYKRRLKRHSLIFSSSTKDNEKGYKDIKNSFDVDEEIIYVSPDCIDFDNIFGQFDIVVYKVVDSEIGIPCPTQDPLYKRISSYCSKQHKSCILVCKPAKLLDINEKEEEFDPVYVTTVQFYSKLRETLYILLYLT